mmetsp:Transcript_71208/g.148555  ORF Transcript_71208/g.148555 Transcript_71208/m.148555 type:complete len:442 (+) Transcript_71208:5023-6348(+)
MAAPPTQYEQALLDLLNAQQTTLANQVAANAANAQAIQDLQQQLVNSAPAPKDPEDSVKYNDMTGYKGREDTEITNAQFVKKTETYLAGKHVPQTSWAKHAAQKLSGGASTWFEGWVNPRTGAAGDLTSTWAEFTAGLESYALSSLDTDALKSQFRTMSGGLSDEGGEFKKVNDAWAAWLLKYRSTPSMRGYYGEDALIDQYTEAMRGVIAGNLKTNRPATIDAAMIQAARIAETLPKRGARTGGQVAGGAAQGKPPGRGQGGFMRNVYGMGGGQASPSPAQSRFGSRAGSPAPGLSSLQRQLTEIQSEIAALTGSDAPDSYRELSYVNGGRGGRGGGGGGSGGGGNGGGGGGSGYRTGPRFYTADNPPPPLTPQARRWCDANHACYSCREPNVEHRSSNCPRFGRDKELGAVDEREHTSGSAESFGRDAYLSRANTPLND